MCASCTKVVARAAITFAKMKVRVQASHKPNSVPRAPYDSHGDNHLSRTTVAHRLKQPTRRWTGEPPASNRPEPIATPPARPCSRWGLPQPTSHLAAGELLPRHFTLTDETLARRAGGLFLWRYPWGRPHWPLASIPLCGVRTFLGRCIETAAPAIACAPQAPAPDAV